METLIRQRGEKRRPNPNTYRVDDCLYIQVRKQWQEILAISGPSSVGGVDQCPWDHILSLRTKKQRCSLRKTALRYATDATRSVIRDGRNPVFVKWRNGATRTICLKWTEKHAKSWWLELERHGFPKLGDLPVDQITPEGCTRCIETDMVIETGNRPAGTPTNWRSPRHIAKRMDIYGITLQGQSINGALPSMTNKKRKPQGAAVPSGSWPQFAT